jgi:hypothetical protein
MGREPLDTHNKYSKKWPLMRAQVREIESQRQEEVIPREKRVVITGWTEGRSGQWTGRKPV